MDGRPNIDSLNIKDKEVQIDASDWEKYKNWDKNDHHHFFTETIQAESGNLAKLLLRNV